MTFLGIGERLVKDPVFVEWLPRLQRNSAAPGDLVRFSRVWFSTDARSALPAIQVPTAVFLREGWASILVEEAKWTADQIPGAQLVTLSGDEGHQAERVRRFATASEKLGLPVRLYDERHTSSEAELRGARDIDAGAATILLEDFLAQRAR